MKTEQELFEIIKNYSDVCMELGVIELNENNFFILPEEQRKRACAQHKIQNLEKLFNQGWIPNWKDLNECKWYPLFKLDTFGELVFDDSVWDSLCFSGAGFYRNEQIAEFIGKTFPDIYQDLLINNNQVFQPCQFVE